MTNASDIQIKELKELITSGFERLDKKIDAIDKKLDVEFARINERFNSIDEKFKAVNQRFDSLEKRSEGQENRFWGLILLLCSSLLGILAKVMFFPTRLIV